MLVTFMSISRLGKSMSFCGTSGFEFIVFSEMIPELMFNKSAYSFAVGYSINLRKSYS